MKILTLNTWQKSGPWEQRWEVIFAGLKIYQPDIIAFQEVFDPDWREIVANRSGYSYFAAPLPTASGLVLLSRLPVIEADLYTLPTQSPFETCRRYVLGVKVSHHDGVLHFFATHLSWKLEDHETRKAQVKEAWRWISDRRGNAPSVLVGDLNATPDSAEIRWLLDESPLVDIFAALHGQEPGYSWDNQNPFAAAHKPQLPKRRIDYIFADSDHLAKQMISCRLVYTTSDERGIFASDHFGVMADFAT